jgi:NADH:ubiquinone oxidoreductase subunit 5 (subunit L)/multisubunit Na+/H+ antiporter MnhA subunit
VASVVASCGIAIYLVFWPLWAAYKAEQGSSEIEQQVYTWIESGRSGAARDRMDTLSAVMTLIVTFVIADPHLLHRVHGHDKDYARFFIPVTCSPDRC